MKKQLALALTAGVAATGAVVASAATLGGVTAKNLGADTAVIASCDTNGITVDYATSTNTTAGSYTVSGIKLSGVAPACSGESLAITLSSGSAGSYSTVATLSSTVPTVSSTATADIADFTVSTTSAVQASVLTHIAVMITGTTTNS